MTWEGLLIYIVLIKFEKKCYAFSFKFETTFSISCIHCFIQRLVSLQ